MGKRGPKNQNLTQILVRLEPSQHEYVVKKSKEWGMSIAAAIRQCVNNSAHWEDSLTKEQTEETKHLNVGRAFAELQNLCKCSIGLEINEYRDYYQSIERAIDELCETENLNESQIEKMRQRKTVIALQFYPETPIGFYRLIGSDLEEVLSAVVAKLAETKRPKVDEHK